MNKPTNASMPNQVSVHSLPWSLRHVSKVYAAEEARDLAAFLCEVTTTPRADNVDIGDTNLGDWHIGLSLCFQLLIDKLDIAAGIYNFPTLTNDKDAPHLCERQGQP